jgi:hypothetical protein
MIGFANLLSKIEQNLEKSESLLIYFVFYGIDIFFVFVKIFSTSPIALFSWQNPAYQILCGNLR